MRSAAAAALRTTYPQQGTEYYPRRGYTERVPDPQDGRKTLARLTTNGKQLKKMFRTTDIHTLDNTLVPITREELETTLNVSNSIASLSISLC